jgi:hypothetical protein
VSRRIHSLIKEPAPSLAGPWRRAAALALIFGAVTRPAAALDPPPLRDPEPLASPRAPEHLRAPVELVPKAVTLLPTCRFGPDVDRCQALGPAFGLEAAVLYRPTPYFAFGGTLGYARARSSLAGGRLSGSRFELSVVGRVYLLEAGELDPYLEGFVGWTSERTTLAWPSGVEDVDKAFGPFGRAGGGVDWFVSSGVKLGVLAGFSEFLLARRERCRAGVCTTGDAPSSTPSGVVTLGLSLSVLVGEAL